VKLNRTLLAIALAALIPVTGFAAIEGTRAEGVKGQEICIIDNAYTGVDFRDAFDRQLRAKGYATRIIHDKAECPITSTFVASYTHGAWGRKLKYAMLTILRAGEEIAVVRYKPSGGPFKGTVESVIGEMVAVLLP
jgi:hypothetical protein